MKRHKEQQVELAEQELKQVKLEIRTDKLKSVATDAATAIASGVGSLFGSGKLKELEYSNSELQLEIVKRDKSIDDLKAQMQHMQEQQKGVYSSGIPAFGFARSRVPVVGLDALFRTELAKFAVYGDACHNHNLAVFLFRTFLQIKKNLECRFHNSLF